MAGSSKKTYYATHTLIMTQPNQLQDIKSDLKDLFKTKKLNILSEKYDPKLFGNFEFVFGTHDIKIRILSDRGQIFADASSLTVAKPKQWYDLLSILANLDCSPHPNTSVWNSSKELTETLCNNFDKIEKFFSNNNFDNSVIRRSPS
jgi:hypothetical protein